jgi:ABC-type transport system involved in multi-copper enzyme maturation permease subunit
MFRLVVAKELREIIASTKFAATFLVCSLLILLTFYVGARNYQVSRTQYEMAQSENLSQMEGLTNFSEIQQHIILPPHPLNTLVSGIANDIGRNIRVREQGELVAEDSRFNDDPIYAVFRFLDLDFVFRIILSLFAILFVYNSISGEKEQGTLRLTFTNNIPRDTYILGKVTGSFLALGIPLLIPILIGCLLLPLMGIPMGNEDWIRLGLVITAGFLFLGAFAVLSLFVSTVTHRSSSSFLILLVAWIFAILIIPRTSVILAGNTVKVLSIDEMDHQKSRHQAQVFEEFKEEMRNFKPSANTAEELSKEINQFMQESSEERERKRSEFADRLTEQRRNQEARQQRLAFGLARISPAASFSLAATNLAGSSLNLKGHYQEEARRYQEIYARFMREKTGGGVFSFRRLGDEEEPPKPIDPREVPEFLYQQPPLGEVVQASILDFGILIFFNLLFFAGAFVAFLRYDVR